MKTTYHKEFVTNLQEMSETYYDDEVEDQNDDALSLCDLTLNNDAVSRPSSPCRFSGFEDHAFEFSDVSQSLNLQNDTILFCGKYIPSRTAKTTSSVFLEQPFSQWKSESFHYDDRVRKTASDVRFRVNARSRSVRSPGTGKCRYGQPCRTDSSRRRFVIGMAKFPPAMELGDMRRRQSRRRISVPMFAAAEEKPPVVAGGGKGHWGLIRQLRFRSNLLSALTRVSFRCILPRV